MSKLKMLAHRKVGVIKVGSVQAATKRVNGRPWMRRRAQALERDKGVCQSCLAAGRVTLAVEVDHIVPLHRGGRDELANLQALCRECHRGKSAAEGESRRW